MASNAANAEGTWCARRGRSALLGGLLAGYATPPAVAMRDLWLQALAIVVFLALGFFAVAWWTARKRLQELHRNTEAALSTLQQREKERDVAQGELFRRLDQEREVNKQKMQLQAQLTDYEKYAALAQLALGAAHEINNPLLGILSHLELELKAAADTETKAEIQQCIRGAKRISDTTRNLLSYARPGPLQLSRISLERLVTDTLSFVRNQPMLRGIKLENSISPDLAPIRADANQLSQILMNLVLNAAEATPNGGTISVSAQQVPTADSIELSVSDSGAGIPADILPHVFEPFFTTKRGKGTGLGLSISQTYVRSHGGDIRVESSVGRGTTVRITLPIRQQTVLTEEEQAEVVG